MDVMFSVSLSLFFLVLMICIAAVMIVGNSTIHVCSYMYVV